MEIKKFRIRNYKSIIDSGDCYPSKQITIFAGKNEAGKTSILEALEDFGTDRQIRESAVRIENKSVKPEISMTFIASEEEILRVCDSAGHKPMKVIVGPQEVCVVKNYPNSYSLDLKGTTISGLDKPQDHWPELRASFEEIASNPISTQLSAKGADLPSLEFKSYEADRELILHYLETARTLMQGLNPVQQVFVNTKITKVIDDFDNATSSTLTIGDSFLDEFLEEVPNFILFSSFEDVFPNEIALVELDENEWIADLERMSDLDVEVIRGTDRGAKKTHKNKLNIELNKDFEQFWTQDFSKLSIDWDSEKLEFWIEENGAFYPPALRSQGRRWHLAFYFRVSARAQVGTSNVILIDEPGLYLHAKAQRDILVHLEAVSNECQIMFSTHSPYLIEPDKLDRVRLVQKLVESGTVVENKIHAVADKETLTPILSAIGLELAQGIIAVERINNVIVEGISDYYYLSAVAVIAGMPELNFVFGGSAGNMPKVGTILRGWGCKVVFLFDSDQGYKDGIKHIKKEWAIFGPELLKKLPVDGAIEDMFTKAEMANILGISEELIVGKNSEHLKTKDKVLPAKKFLENVRAGRAHGLGPDTMKRWRELLQEFTVALKHLDKLNVDA